MIVGGGLAGGQAAATLRQNGYSKTIDLVCAEPIIPYQRPPLSKEYLRGQFDEERVHLRPIEFYEKHGITVHTGTPVSEISVDRKIASCPDGPDLSYDSLVLATGSVPRRLSLAGSDLKGVYYLRTLADASAIRRDFSASSSALIVGGGYIGLEVAAACRDAGLAVTVIEIQDRLLERVTTPSMSRFCERLHERRGVSVRCGMAVEELAPGRDNSRVGNARLTNGDSLDTDLVVIGVGVLPETRLAESAGLECDNGILVDESCRTSVDGIWAIGDCTSHPSRLYGKLIRLESVPNAMEQARIVGKMLTGTAASYDATPWFWSDQYDVKLQMVGLSSFGETEVIRGDPDSDAFCVFHFRGDTLVAADTVNSRMAFLAARRLVGRDVPPEVLADAESDLRTLLVS